MDPYTKTKKIGSGGFGEVWRAERTADSTSVAIKYLHPSAGEDSLNRFKTEVRCLSSLRHPNILKILDMQLTVTPFYYVSPLYAGSLYDALTSICGNTARIKHVFGAILEAMRYAHSQGVIHRDLKSDNVLLNSDAEVVVSDFGLGRLLDPAATRLTVTGDRFGTPYYVAPEQLMNAKSADERSDIFGLGRLLYELYTGPLTSAVQDPTALPGPIAMIVETATRRDPAKRYATVFEMADAFHSAMAVLLGEVQSESLAGLLAELVMKPDPTQQDVKQLAQKFSEALDDQDTVHSQVMLLSPSLFARLEQDNLHMARRLIQVFARHIGEQSWGFDYCDDIARSCRHLFEATSDAEIRADLLGGLLQLGTGHNRWFVMEQFGELLGLARDDVEAHQFATKLKQHEHLLGRVKRYIKRETLKPTLLGLLRVAEEHSRPEPGLDPPLF